MSGLLLLKYKPMAEIPISQIDALIHPDYHLRWESEPDLTPGHIRKRLRWDARAEALADNPQAVMLYFSTFIKREPHTGKITTSFLDNELYGEDRARIVRYKKMLGKRFFLFPGLEKPTGQALQNMFSQRDFFFNPRPAYLHTYGEYYELCVDTWNRHLVKVLKLPAENSRRIGELSVYYGYEVDSDSTF